MSLAASSLPENLFQRLLENLPGFSWIVSLDPGRPRLLYASPTEEPLFQWLREEFTDDLSRLASLISHHELPRLTDFWQRLQKGEAVSGEFHLRDANGAIHLVIGRAFPLDREDCGPPLIAGFCHNTTGCSLRRRAEDALAWEARVNAALAEVSQAVLKLVPVEDLSRLVLAQAQTLTGSEEGSVAFRQGRELVFIEGEGEAGGPSLLAHCPQNRLNYAARWARCLADQQVFLSNEPPDTDETREISTPHHRFLCAPAVFRGRLLGQIALATNRRDYEARDVDALTRLASLYAIALCRQQAEEALRESEERFRSLVEATSDLIWETDAEGRLTYISPNVQNLLGYTPAEVIGKTFQELLEPEEAERMSELLSPILEARRPYVYVGKTMRHRGGKRLVIESSGVPVVDCRGGFLGYRGIDRDITERHRASEALFRETEKYRTLVEESPLGVAIVGEDGTYKYINPKFVEIFGYTLADVPTGRDWFAQAFPDPELRRQVIDTWYQDLRDYQVGEARPRTFPVSCKDGSQKIINFRPVTLATGDQLVIYEDVTEHHRAEAALRESEAKYRLLVKNIPAVVFRGYADWYVEFFDDKVEELTGYPREDFKWGRIKWCELILPEDLGECQDIFRQALKTSGAYVRQYRIRHRLGHILWIEARGQIVRDPNSRIDHVYGVFFDITKQKEIEEALRESKENLKTIMDSIRAGVVLIDTDSLRIMDINHYAAEMVGLPRDQLMGNTCRGLICQKETDVCLAEIPALLPGETEHRLLTSHSGPKPILKTAATFKRGGRTYLLESFLDLSQQKKVEQDLFTEKERLRVTLRSIGEGVIATDREGRVVLMNQVAETLTGWTQEDAFGQPVSKVLRLVQASTRKPLDNRVDKVIRKGRVLSLPAHTMLLARDGAERILSASAAPIIDQEGKVIGVVLVFQDVTLKRQTEAELQKMEKLTSVGILAGGIAHDFNNILTGILGNLSLAMLSLTPEDQTFRRLIEAEQATLRARDLVQQLLTFAKGGAPVKEVSCLEEIIRESATFACRGSQVRCDFVFPKDLWPAEVDPGQISQVIQNLVINAIQAMPTGGTITIKAVNITLKDDQGVPLPPGRYLKISIKDQGIGIPADYLPRIFDPYFSTKQKGSGLGLATAYSIIKNHEGYMTVESTLGVGTTFYVYLPSTAKKPKAASKDGRPLLHKGEGRVLIMDDDAGVRQVAGKILAHLGYEVEYAENGDRAIEKYKEARQSGRPFDLVIMDLTIPGGMGGKEALQALRRLDPHTRAIVSSGYANDPIMTRYKEYGFCGVIKKPYKVDTFSHVVYQVLKKSEV
ncbi:MAG: PAS domain S-box protein [Desulfobaccales bacterium]